jgi:hypothetical protein
MVTAATNECTQTRRKECNKHAIFPAQLGAAFLGFLFGLHRLEAFHPRHDASVIIRFFWNAVGHAQMTSQQGHTPEHGLGVDHAHL